ncbi:MAG: glycoside hydrolase family 38 C-terminal domain-containing protein [Candidatus Zhuqueibacterota bacterium]
MRLHLIANSHIDPVWLWDKFDGIDEVINTFRSACDRLDEYPGLTFSASSMQFYHRVNQYDKKLFARIQAFVEQGRWEIVGGWWVESDTNLPSEASLLKQAEIGQKFCRTHFNREIEVAFLPDSFGHPATLPKILSESGFKYFIFCRPDIREKPDLPANLFHWEFQGRRVLAYRLKHMYAQYGSYTQQAIDPSHLLKLLEDEEYRTRSVNCYFFGLGDHGGGPSIAEIEFYNHFISTQPEGEIGYSSCLQFFKEAEQRSDIPDYQGDLFIHAVGCYSVMRPVKHAIRSAEHGLDFARRAVALVSGHPPDLSDHWRKILFNQFHDIMPGSCAASAAAQALDEIGSVADAWRNMAYSAFKSLSQTKPVKIREGEFRIFNSLNVDVRAPLSIESSSFFRNGAAFRDETGAEILIQDVLPSVRCANRRWEFVDALPAGGFKSYYFDQPTPQSQAPDVTAHFIPGDSIATDRASVQTGIIAVTTPVRAQYQYRFLALSDASDTWGHGVTSYHDVEGVFSLISSSKLTGPVLTRLYQRWAFSSSWIDVIVSLYNELPQIYIDVKVNWAERRKILKMEIAPGHDAIRGLTMQAPGGVVQRRTDGMELPLHHWLKLTLAGGELGLVQNGAFACDCTSERLRVTLVRSSLYAFHDPTMLSPDDPQHDTDQGEHTFRFSLCAGADLPCDALERETASFLEPFLLIREGQVK